MQLGIPLDRSAQSAAAAESSRRQVPDEGNPLRRFPGNHSESGYDSRLQLLIDAVVDYAIFLLDPQGNVQTWNAGAQKLKGYARRRDHRPALLRLLSARGGRRRLAAEELRRAAGMAASRTRAGGCARTAAASGPTWSSPRLHDESGELIGFAKITRDLTERRARGAAARQRGAVPPAGRKRAGLRHLHARPGRHGAQLELRAPSASRATGRRDHRPALLRLLHAGGPAGRQARGASCERARPTAGSRTRAGGCARTASLSGPTW